MDNKNKLKFFHGPTYSEGYWNSKTVKCCSLCKTQNTEGKLKHWARCLCRSCYRRLSASHRLYNDKWNQENSKSLTTRKSSQKKDYKYKNTDDLTFSESDVETLLDRYGFKCAYSNIDLQGYDHKAANAFQVEYRVDDAGETSLVPVSRAVNCSKKNLSTDIELKKWAREKGMKYPFNFIDPPKS